ncbi:Enoyl-CoA hydratase [hydrothermal vent metagenome]|uniref:Enoyl-CoA hydratase n=1 Tax=hydrothermal vent metagenome TaxID=652676 RepID=A0A3B0ZJR3_9ZZZZ
MEQSNDDVLQRRLHHLKVTHDPAHKAVWVEFKFAHRPCFTTALLDDLMVAQHSIRQTAQQQHQLGNEDRLQFQVLASSDTRAFNLGGDLAHFIELIERRDRNGLLEYAKTCIDIQFASVTHYDIPFTTIALVQGEALGGGFEAALSNNVIIAEESARFGFPELSFGMFPGMGAISLLTRKITPAMARRLIMDRRVHTAEELYDMGVIDVLAADGEGREAAANYMQRHSDIAPGLHGFQAAVDRAMPVSYEELYDIVEHWVDTALQLSKKNRRLMSYFARAQSRQQRTQLPPLVIDWRNISPSRN